MNTTLRALLTPLRDGDASVLPVLADWLEEQGDGRAAEVRVAATLPRWRALRAAARLFPGWRKDELMGCDVHCYVEYRARNPQSEYDRQWSDLGGRINPGRNYVIFERLAGVRGDPGRAVVPPRGYPDDAGFWARHDNWCFITNGPDEEGNYVTPEKARNWHERLGCDYRQDRDGKPCWIEHPDWHSHSWLTPDEWEKALKLARVTPKNEPEYYALLAAMRSLEAAGHLVRVVFWFDN